MPLFIGSTARAFYLEIEIMRIFVRKKIGGGRVKSR
jgi:hypothetical protein